MRGAASRSGTFVAGAAVLLAVAGCGDAGGGSDGDTAAPESYGHALEAPARSAYTDASDEEPRPEEGRAELSLDSGAQVVLWIDPKQAAKVYEQHSDPDAGSDAADDPEAWTEPDLLYTAGDGCLFIDAVTDGSVVAATLGCYETDAFLQQAPDQGQAVVTTDLQDWQVQDAGELFEKPSIAGDGDSVSWPDGPSWTRDGGFS